MRSLLLGAVLFCADGCTDMTKLTVTFHSFVNAPKNTALHNKYTSSPGRSRNLPSCHEGNTHKYYNTSNMSAMNIYLSFMVCTVCWTDNCRIVPNVY